MEFDIGTILSVVSFALANPIVLGALVGLFVGWNLPQPAFAKYIQDKVVGFLSVVWNKIRNNDGA
jgi:hypothetical protein